MTRESQPDLKDHGTSSENEPRTDGMGTQILLEKHRLPRSHTQRGLADNPR